LVWQFHFSKEEGKPYFHPLNLPDGTTLTSLRPADHPWHRGLWWSWKFINGLNYWEEDPKSGLSAGRTEITAVTTIPHADGSAHISMDLSYHPPGAPPVMLEKRELSVSAPDSKGSYQIGWISVFTTGDQDVKLDRTPLPGEPGGVGYGGYAGLSARMSTPAKSWVFTSSERTSGAANLHGRTARWVDFSGETSRGAKGGLTMFDDPRNLRYPTHWYVNQEMPYFSPAPLFKEAFMLGAGKTVTLRYTILIHSGSANGGDLQ
jgi:hypothetical protein